jgi:hypothetical protein
MIDENKQKRLDRFFESKPAHKCFGKSGFDMNENIDYYMIWDWMVTNKKGADSASRKFGIDAKSIYRWIERTEHNLEDTTRDKLIDGVAYYQCSGCDEIKEVSIENFSPQKNKRGFRAKCRPCMNKESQNRRTK